MSNAKPDPGGAVKFTKREINESPYKDQDELKDRLRAFAASSQCWDFLVELCDSAPRDLWTDRIRLAKHMHDWLSVRAKDPDQAGLRLFMDQYGFAVCGDLGEMLAGYYREEVNLPTNNQQAGLAKPPAQRAAIVRSVMKSAADFRDHEKVLELARRLDSEGIKLPVRRGPQRTKTQPQTFMEAAKSPNTSREYKRIFDPRTGTLVRDLTKR